LDEARAELATLRSREVELERQIADAEAVLANQPAGASPNAQMTLHEALAHVLRERGKDGMTAPELADAINQRRLYRKRDGNAVAVNQVQARVNNYSSLFQKSGSIIQLREDSPMLSSTPESFTIFQDDDDAFFDWLEAHPDGSVVNTERHPKPNYLVLHRPVCPHFKGGKSLHWTKDYVKVCAIDRAELEEWAATTVGGELTLCRSCFG
jgi:hypothetical protein